ncbi:RGCVC family protein [Amycolatopsis sp. NPDC049688]
MLRPARHTHDLVARRFCRATVAGGFNRGCVCVGRTTSPGR